MTSLTPTVTLVDGTPRASSLDIAQKFGKRHDHVLRAIANALEQVPEEFGQPNFGQSSYINEQGKEQPMYHLTRDGFSYVCMGFTGKEAAKWKVAYIEAFNVMEAELTAPKAPPEIESKTRRGRKALPAPDPTERQLDGLIDRVRFYIREIAEAEKQVDAILLAERSKSRQGRFSADCPQDRVYLNMSCSQRTLWSSLDFGLKAVEENVKAVLAVARM